MKAEGWPSSSCSRVRGARLGVRLHARREHQELSPRARVRRVVPRPRGMHRHGQPLLLRKRRHDRAAERLKNKALAKTLNIGDPEALNGDDVNIQSWMPNQTKWDLAWEEVSAAKRDGCRVLGESAAGRASSDASSRRPAGAGSTLPVICFLLAVFVLPARPDRDLQRQPLNEPLRRPDELFARQLGGLPPAGGQRLLGPLQVVDGDHAARLGGRRRRRLSARVLPRLRRHASAATRCCCSSSRRSSRATCCG